LLAWPGIMGEFMRFMPITLISVLGASLLVELVFVPNMGALVFRKPISGRAKKTDESSGGYRHVLKAILPNSGWVVMGAGGFMVGAYAIFAVAGNGLEFFPEVEPQRLAVEVRSPGDFAIHEKHRLVRQVEDELLKIDGVNNVFTRIADRFDNNSAGTIGVLQLELDDWDRRPPADEIIEEIRGLIAPIIGLDVKIEKAEEGPAAGKPINVQILALTHAQLHEATELLLARMDEIGGFTEVVDSRPPPGIEWQLHVDRAEAARYGVDIATVGQNIQLLTQGIKLGEYRPDDLDDELDIRARLPRESRDIESLDHVQVSTANGQMSLGDFVQREVEPRVSTINRADSSRVVTVESEVAPGILSDQQLRVLAASLAERPLIYANGETVRVRFKGENEDLQESMVFLSKAFIFAVVLMAAILLTQFNSFYQSFVVMSAVVFSTGGVMLGLALAGKPFGVVMSGIGVIALAGVVVNNNIVLIDAYNELRRKGYGLVDAVVESGAQRFRPVLLTTATTVLGLTPMVLQMNVDLVNRAVSFGAPSTQYWSQLATALAGGLLFATALTLLVTPCMLVLGERLRLLLGMRLNVEENEASHAAPNLAESETA
ncbi:MAG: efflux RND transporter permease subunit, partial [Gammaproteobacteria bacterium]|nr:efflux RND transporter permease subunit [Gammaproteobacteria bacterium]